MRFVEETGGSWTAEQLRAAEAEIEQQKREWEANRLAALKKEEEDARQAELEENDIITYSREDAKNQVNNISKPINRRLLKVKRGGGLTTKRRRGAVATVKKSSTVATAAASSKRRQIILNSKIKSKKRKVQNTKSSSFKRERTPKRTSRRNRTGTLSSSNMNSGESRSSLSNGKHCANKAEENDADDESPAEESANSSTVENSMQTSEDFDDSECSLDVMYDSIAEESETNTTSQDDDENNEHSNNEDVDDEEDAEHGNYDEEDDNGEEISNNDSTSDSSNGKENSKGKNIRNTSRRRFSVKNEIDINSPRTRSRGTVKLNLWTLDESPILPGFSKKKKSLNTTPPAANAPTDASTPVTTRTVEDSKCATENSDCDDKQPELILNDTQNMDDVGSSIKQIVKNAKIQDGFQKTSASGSIGKIVKKNVKKVILDGKRNKTLDSWISKSPRTIRALSPKVVLNKSEITKHMNQSDDCIMRRTTRKASIFQFKPTENGS